MKEMSLQCSEIDREVVALCSICNHNRATFLYTTGCMSGIARCNNCNNELNIHFLKNSKLNKFGKADTNI